MITLRHVYRDFPTSIIFVLLLLTLALIPANARASSPSRASLATLPLPAQATISATLGRDDARYHARPTARGLRLDSPSHGFSAVFTSAGIRVTTGAATWGLHYQGAGYGAARPASPRVVPTAQANRVAYRRGPLTEWYVNGPRGLQQSFTLTAPPGPRTGAPLTLTFALAGTLQARVEPETQGLTLTQADGRTALTYRGLTAWDATGRTLPARLQLHGSALTLQVDDQGARYPLTIDPFIQQAKLTASDGAASDLLGTSAAISGDTIVVGAPSADIGANADQGAAYVFVKPDSGWSSMTQVAKLTASDGAAGDLFGSSVAIDGNTVVVGRAACQHELCVLVPAAYVFVKPGSGWANMSQTAKLTPSDGVTNDYFGTSVAISGDTVVVGAPGAINVYTPAGSTGAAYVFVKPATGWANMSQTAKLATATGYYGTYHRFGTSVAISGDTVVAGAPDFDIQKAGQRVYSQGAAYVFVKPATGWATTYMYTGMLVAYAGAAYDHFGTSVAISGDTVVVGAPSADTGANTDQGAAYVFVKPGTWAVGMSETGMLLANDGTANDLFGSAVAISGNTVVVGLPDDYIGNNPYQGAAYVFVKPGSGWANMSQTEKLTASDGAAGDRFGASVAISGDTVVVGAREADVSGRANQGAAYVFADRTSLLVTKAGTGSGTVTSSPAGIDCGATCYASFITNSSVTLTAFADLGSTFDGWSGHCTGTANPTTVTMNMGKTCNAIFSSGLPFPPGPPRSLTITKAGTGSGTVTSSPAGIDCGTDCSESYTNGTGVTLTAFADLGSTFDGWSGDCTGTASSITVTMDANKSCTASFTSTPTGPSIKLLLTDADPGFVVRNPITVSYTVQGCSGQEMFLVLDAPAMGIPWSYLNSTGGWVPLPATRAAITPYGSGPPDGTYTLYTGTVPSGSYELYLGCDFVVDGHLTLGPLNIPNGISDHVSVFVP